MPEQNTESVIKEAARKIFQQKGFAATKTRDIAEAAGINLALLNYYFRSKRKLYDLIMMETIQNFFSGLAPVIDDEQTSIREKINLIVDRYIDLLSDNPATITFILNEVREHPDDFVAKAGFLKKIKKSVFLMQFMEAVKNGTIPPINPLHFMMNFGGLLAFPFIATPLVSTVSGMSEEDVIEMIQERKRLIPMWLDAMLSVK